MLINVQGADNSSFKWCLHADKYGGELVNPEYASNYYQYENEFSDYLKPMELSEIKSFEHREHISVNVYRLIGGKLVDALQITALYPENVHRHVDLLPFDNAHYVLIRACSERMQSV